MTAEEGDDEEANEKIERALDDRGTNGEAVNDEGLSGNRAATSSGN